MGSGQSLHAVFEHSIKAKSIAGFGWRERRQTMAMFFRNRLQVNIYSLEILQGQHGHGVILN